MKKIQRFMLALTMVCAAIFTTGCEDKVTVMTWHEFKIDSGNVSGDAATYVQSEFKKLQDKYYQVNTTREQATDALTKFCSDIEQGVKDGEYTIVGDDVYAQFSVIDPTTPTIPVATQKANFTKTRDQKSYTMVTLTFKSLLGDKDAIEEQLKKLSFYSELSPKSVGDDIVYEYTKEHDVDTDLEAEWRADSDIINNTLSESRTYEGSSSIFSTKLNYSYRSVNEKNSNLTVTVSGDSYLDSPTIYTHKFTQSVDGDFPTEFTFSAASNEADAPHFIEYKIKADGTELADVIIVREGSDIISRDSTIAFEVISATEVKLTKYANKAVEVTYTIEKR